MGDINDVYLKERPSYSPPDQARRENTLIAAKLMMNAAFTAPLVGGVPQIESNIVCGNENMEKIARKMEELAYLKEDQGWQNMFKYEAVMVRESDVILFIGSYRTEETPLDVPGCGLCGGRPDCSYVYEKKNTKLGLIDITDRRSDKLVNGPLCGIRVGDMGYAVASALFMATRLMVDSRPFVSVGMAGQKLGYCPDSPMVVGIPVAAQHKNPYVDINPYYHLINMEKIEDATRKTYIIMTRMLYGVDYRKWDVAREFIYAPCEHVCPLHLDVVGYIALIAEKKFEEAFNLIRQRNPLIGTVCRVCHHPCEEQCKRGELDEGIAINSLKRFVADYGIKAGIKSPVSPVTKSKDEKVAIIGSGPSGLNAAYHLIKQGYPVTIFESLPVAGGMLSVGIPEYRLPRKVLETDIEFIISLGVEIKTNTPIGKELSLNDLFEQAYKAIFIATGAHQDQKPGIPGEDLEGVFGGVTFLRDNNLDKDKKMKLKGKVAVIGGGNVAIDAARSAIRLGAQEVSILYRRSRDEMLAVPEEIEEAEREGIEIIYLVTPTRILGDNKKVNSLECIRTKLGEPDPSGRKRPIPIEGSQFLMETDIVITAIGQTPDFSFLPAGHGLEIANGQTLQVNSVTLATNRAGVFAGGDVVTGPATVVEAMEAGMRAAISIDKYFRGEKMVEEVIYPERREEIPRAEEVPKGTMQPPMPKIPIKERTTGFGEVNLGYSEEKAIKEAKRCVRCDLERGTSALLFGKENEWKYTPKGFAKKE